MLTLIEYPIASIAALVVLYLWFRAAMWYLRHKHELREKSGIGLVLLEIGLAPGLVLDIIINWTIGGVLGYVMCLTLSAKLCHIRQHPKYGFAWQRRFADWACDEVLNKWDPTHHHC
jgi:hypothetical protein